MNFQWKGGDEVFFPNGVSDHAEPFTGTIASLDYGGTGANVNLPRGSWPTRWRCRLTDPEFPAFPTASGENSAELIKRSRSANVLL
jgi:hypothetical protein